MTFARDMRRISSRINSDMEDTALAVKLEVLRGVVENTRVREGRARGNWQVTQDQPSRSPIERLDKQGDRTIAQGLADIEPIGLTFITNNVPYIRKLEELDGMVAKTVARVRRILRDA